MGSNELKTQEDIVKKILSELKSIDARKQILQYQVLKGSAAGDSQEANKKLTDIKNLEKKQLLVLKTEKAKLSVLKNAAKEERKQFLDPKIEKVKNFVKTAKKYGQAAGGTAAVISGLSFPADAIKIQDRVNKSTISAKELADKKQKAKRSPDKFLNNLRKTVEEDKKQKKDGDKDNIKQLLKERDLDIKKGMAVEGKKVGEATRNADKRLLKKLNNDNPLLNDENAKRLDIQNGIKAELQKKTGAEGRKLYEDKLREEARKQEAARVSYYQKLNQDNNRTR
jgi:hypothetical protein